uniref:CSON009745 protein n=1 Tax=Culicoides sonorensis TaxID=179676 RepID=A0A336JZW6_CULSO
MLKSKTKDSDSEGSNVSPKLLEVPITHDHTNDHTISSTETTQSTILSSTESTTLPALSSSNVNNMEVQTLTEKSNQNEITTTERQVHQTVELKTSEVFNDDNSKTTSEKSLLEVKSEVQKPSTEDPLNKEAKNNEKMALEDPKDLLSTSEQFNEKNSTGTNVLKEESTTLGSVESTTKLNEIKESLTESSSLALDIISVTLTNALSSISETDKETTSTTINLSSESPLEVTRESKVFNETREATTLRWTTERNINWTLETSSVSSLTSLPTETSILTTTMPASDLVTLNSESDITTDVPKKDKTTTVSTKTNEEEEGELVSNEGLKSILNIKIMPVTDAPTSTTESSSSESDEELDVDVVTQHEEITTCESETCRKEAAKLLNKMNVEVDPCDDFYSYACGNFIKSTNFENGKNSITSIELFQRAIDEKLEKLLSSPIQNEDIDPYKIAKLLYGTCIKDLSHNSNNMNSFIEILENLGGIPIMKGTIWDSNRFNWLTLVQNLTKTGFYSSNLFDFTIQPSEKDFDFYGGKYIVKISPSNTILTKEKLNHLRNKEEIDRYKMYIAKVIRKLNNYLNYTAISKDISDIVAFEVQLVSLITKTEFESTDQLFTLKGLNSEFSFFNWSEIFSTYTSNINADDEILLANKKYLQGLENLINITDSRTLANYVLWRVVESSTLYLSKELQQIHDNYHLTQSYVTCSELVRKEIPLISSAMYSENYLNDNDNPELRNQVIEDVEGILDFTMGLLRWLDEESRVLAQKRLNETIRFITVPQELEKININSYFTELDYQNGSLLYQVLNVHKFNQMKEFQKLKTPVDKHEWTRFGDLLNILDYKPSERYILAIPATLIQEQLSDPTTSVIDYATIGLVIARDYIFRFMGLYDPVGTTYNSHGSWWSNESLNNFEPYMQCFVDKYSKFQTPDGIKLKSKHLRYENIVDVGALRAAHTAFKYLGDTVEERLPGIQYNEPRQIFWTRVAQNWCSKYTPDELKRVLLRGNEVPGKFRVNGALMQLRDFGKDFECKIGAPMYPDKNSCYGLKLFFICSISICSHGLGLPSSAYSYDVTYDADVSPIAVIGLESGSGPTPRLAAHQKIDTIGRELVDTEKICLEPGCIHAASDLLEKMNLDANPCEDFYEFACGKFVKETFISDEKTSVNTFVTMRDKLKQQLRMILEEKPQDDEIAPFKQAKLLYKTCMNKTQIAKKGETPILKLLNIFGGMPALVGSNWDESKFSWVETVKKFRQMGLSVDYVMDFSVSTDTMNSTRRLIEFDQPGFRLSREFLIKGRNNSNVMAYYEYIRDLTVLLGADYETASKDISDMVDFEIALANITTPREQRRNATLLYNTLTLKKLQEKYTWLDWFGYISAILPADIVVDENEIINIVDLKFFDNLGNLLENTPKRTISNFMLGRVAASSVKYLTDKLRKRQQEYFKVVYGQSEEEARWKECTETVLSKLPNAISAMYVRRHFDEDAKKTALEMVQDIKEEFERVLKNVEWMDVNTREQAIKKLQSMSTLIAYPDELNQDDVLIDYYKNLVIDETSYLQSNHKITIFLSDLTYRKLREPIIKNEWKTWAKAAQVNAFYNRAHNHIKFPAGILQGHFFSPNRPKYLNYAAIGSVIGHEITHGFDDQGSQFDAIGNLNDWWAPATKEAFREKAKCIINQYNSTIDAQTNLTLNGINTQGENIADNGGIQIAFAAYERYLERHGTERLLPGLRYTPQQLYWIAMSQNWCSKYRTEALKVHITQQSHPPGKYRVLIPLMNNNAFAKDFQCQEGSPMNPVKKCRVCNPNWWKRRSMMERFLIIFISVSLITIASLSYTLFYNLQNNSSNSKLGTSFYSNNMNIDKKNAEMCLTPDCIHSASSVMDKIDPNINPCDDFYDFACGNFIKTTNIPDDKSSVNMFSVIEDTLADQLSYLLSSEPSFDDIKPFVLAKFMYSTCVATTDIETTAHQTLKKLLKKIGGWPVLMTDNWNETWTWEKINQESSNLGFTSNYMLAFSVASDWMNSSRRILDVGIVQLKVYLDEPRLGLIQEYLMKGFEEMHVTSYYQYMVEVALLLGADKKIAEEELKKSLEFEIELAKISMSRSDRRNLTIILNRITIEEMQKRFNYTDWLNYINGLLPTGLVVDKNELISVTSVIFLTKLEDLLKRTPRRTIANYYVWRIIDYSITYLSRDLRDKLFAHKRRTTGQLSEEPRWKECTDIINNRLSAAVGALYVRRYFQSDSKKEALEMVKNIRIEFEQTLKTVSWMDEQTRAEALRKLNKMETLIGYPDELMDDEKLIKYHADLNITVTNSFLENMLDIQKFFTDFEFKRLRQVFNKTDWMDHSKPADVNAYYSGIENNIQFPAGILQGVFFAGGRPKYMNYGAMGLVIGHEITHGYDDTGREFNAEGNHVDWWQSNAKDQFIKKAKCIVDQYANFTEPMVGEKLNGVNTQGENIADNGGVKVSYRAYTRWVKTHGREPVLPGLSYTDLQLFWISAAQSWCSVYTPETLKSKIITEYHSPERFRIIGSLSNAVDFAKDFNCPIGSTMNPIHKCEVCEILNSIGDNSIAVLLPSNQNLQRKINEILKESFTSLTLQTVLFTDQEKFFMYVETSLKGSIQTTNIIFDTPEFIISEIKLRNLAHRLSLFLFYWGAVSIDEINSMEIEFKEPLRVAIITRPRKKVYRIYYNQAVPDGSGKMKLVNWYDFNSLGLYKEPLLPRLETVFKKLEWRTLYFPAINTPPWLFVNYKKKENLINGSFDTNLTSSEFEQSLDYQDDYKENNNDTNLEVTGGRDDALLKLIAQKMQFNIQYVDPPERTQGSIIGNSDINFTFSGGIGMIQRREADMFLGDIPLSWERRQAVEFTFFTLADSGAFATHAPRKLSEALVLIRPFLWEVWPILAITVVISAPALYFVIICPYFFEDNYDYFRWKHLSYKNESWVDSRTTTAEKFDHDTHFYYINEITGDKKCSLKKTQLIQYNGIPTGFLSKVTWFIVNLYLKQSVEFKHKTNRARFLAMTIWLGATYVLGDMYSAQLTSQLARPAKESPLNTLHKLEYAMQFKEYQLYVEKGSAAQTIIENGTGTFARLYTLMRKQPTYVVDSVEDGIISIITYGSRAVLGGRGTLYYNTKLFGSTNFHISEKLYTRYSAIAVQNGCLFLDSLNIM